MKEVTCDLLPMEAWNIVAMEDFMRGKEIVCMQCDKPERSCTCDKFCYMCKGEFGIRLCEDGLYYCPDCREACDIRAAESNE